MTGVQPVVEDVTSTMEPSIWKAARPLVVEEVSRQEMEGRVAQVGREDGETDWTVDGCYEPGGISKRMAYCTGST